MVTGPHKAHRFVVEYQYACSRRFWLSTTSGMLLTAVKPRSTAWFYARVRPHAPQTPSPSVIGKPGLPGTFGSSSRAPGFVGRHPVALPCGRLPIPGIATAGFIEARILAPSGLIPITRQEWGYRCENSKNLRAGRRRPARRKLQWLRPLSGLVYGGLPARCRPHLWSWSTVRTSISPGGSCWN